jgi:8-oxo-dGTP diphosphatase
MASQDDSPSEGGRRSASPQIRLGTKALIDAGSRVLLVEERHADGSTFWTLPGGGVRAAEAPVDGLRRELAEELRCRAVVGAPIDGFWYSHRSGERVSWYQVFDCSLTSEPIAHRPEGVLAQRWVDPESPPANTLLPVRQLLRAHSGDRPERSGREQAVPHGRSYPTGGW